MSANAGEIVRRLEGRYPTDKGWVTFTEFPLWTKPEEGHGRERRIDFLAYGLWNGTGWRTVAVEVKVARSDWLAELEDPEKRRRAETECSEFWIAAAKGVVDPSELPDGVGLFEVYGKGLRKKRAARYYRDRRPGRDIYHHMVRRLQRDISTERLDHARTREEYAELHGEPLSLERLRWISKAMVEQERQRKVDPYGRHRSREQRKADAREWTARWERVHKRILEAMRRTGMERKTHWKVTPEDVLTWVEAQTKPAEMNGHAVDLAKKLRSFADELDTTPIDRRSDSQRRSS